MSNIHVVYRGFGISLATGWEDITAELGEDYPFTFANPDQGVGALQISSAHYDGGQLPRVSQEDLASMLDEYSASSDLKEPFDQSTYSNEIIGIGCSYRTHEDFTRIWYFSDGMNILLVTYACDWGSRSIELEDCEKMVCSIRFYP